MLNRHSVTTVDNATWGSHFRKPLYGSYCFSRIPHTVRSLLGDPNSKSLPADILGSLSPRWDTVLFFFIDAFGWRLLDQALQRSTFLQHLSEQGVLSKLTAQFPSTTAAHVTTAHTGLSVGENGVYAWSYYEPRLGSIILPLRFAFLGRETNSLAQTGFQASDLLPRQTLYEHLSSQGVRSLVLGGVEYIYSPYSQAVNRGAEVIGYRSLAEGFTNLLDRLDQRTGKTYAFFYYDKIDSLCHVYGPTSPQVAAEIESFWLLIEHFFHRPAQTRLKNTLLLLSADHGHAATPPEQMTWINRVAPEIVPALQTDRLKRPLAQAGSRRDHFLHVREESLTAVQETLQHHLNGRAEVHLVRDLIEQGFFCEGPPSQEFLERVGNLVILPYRNESTWWYDPARPDREGLASTHGGLSPDEMDIPLVVYPYE